MRNTIVEEGSTLFCFFTLDLLMCEYMEITDKYFVNYEQSKKLTELGFPKFIDGCPFMDGWDFYGNPTTEYSSTHRLEYLKVPLSVAQTWLREEKEFDVLVRPWDNPSESGRYDTIIRRRNKNNLIVHDPWRSGIQESYEDALSEGIGKALEMLLWKK